MTGIKIIERKSFAKVLRKLNLNEPKNIFLLLAIIFGTISSIIMPLFNAPDEGAHFWQSYGLFSKNTQVPKDLLVSPEYVGDSIKDNTYVDLFQDKVNFEDDEFTINIFAKEFRVSRHDNAPTTGVSLFGSLSHIPQALGVLIGKALYPSVGIMVLFGRLFNLAIYIMAIYLIIKKVRHGKWVFVFLALTPMMIQQAGSLSYDVVNIAAVFAWMAMMINLFTQKTSLSYKQLVAIVLLGILLCLTKQSNILLLLFIPFLPKRLYVNTKPIRWLTARKNLLRLFMATGGILLLITIMVGVRFFLVNYNLEQVGFKGLLFLLRDTFFNVNINHQLDTIVTTGIFGNFSWLYYRLPEWFVIIEFFVLLLVLLREKLPRVNTRFAVISGSIFLLSILLITVGMYSWTIRPFVQGNNPAFIEGMQGRYFTPLLVLLIPPFAYLQKTISIKDKTNFIPKLIIIISVVAFLYYVWLTAKFFYGL
jgi:uncharacterized membrane protein